MIIPLTSRECHEFEYKFVRKLQDKITCILFFIFYVNISTSIFGTYWLFLREILFIISRKCKSFVLQISLIYACISCKVLLIIFLNLSFENKTYTEIISDYLCTEEKSVGSDTTSKKYQRQQKKVRYATLTWFHRKWKYYQNNIY